MPGHDGAVVWLTSSIDDSLARWGERCQEFSINICLFLYKTFAQLRPTPKMSCLENALITGNQANATTKRDERRPW